MWKNIEAAPADAILGLTEAFKNDDNTQKVNLGVGVYKDEQGNTPILSCIKTAENMLLEDQITNCLLYTSPSPRDLSTSRMPSSA